MGYGTSYTDDSDGAPQPGAVRKPPAKPTKCNRCGAVIQPGDLVIRHETKRKLVACAKCAAEGGFSHLLQRYE
jgi:RNase P subunit RPR2